MITTNIDKELSEANYVVFDAETNSLEWWREGAELLGLAVYFPHNNQSYYLDASDAYEYMTDFFIPGKTYVGHNIGFDIGFMRHVGFEFPDGCTLIDTSVMAHLLNENVPNGLKDLAVRYLNDETKDEQTELLEKIRVKLGKKSPSKATLMSNMGLLDAEDIAPYAEDDARKTWKLYEFFLPYLVEWDQVELFHELCNSYLPALIDIKERGMLISREYLLEQLDTIGAMHTEALEELHTATGTDLNPNSPQQVTEFLGSLDATEATLEGIYLGLIDKVLSKKVCPVCKNEKAKAKCKECKRKGYLVLKSEPYTDDMKSYSRMIVNCKKIGKQISFVKGLLAAADDDNVIHASLNINGTVTFRLSCSNPNLQQVPKPTKRFNLRKAFVAPEGYKFVEIDWKGQELRIACHFAEEEKMATVLDADGDMHQITADKLGVSRAVGKAANFGTLYGIGAETAYKKWQAVPGMTLELAGRVLKEWRKEYSNIAAMNDYWKELAERPRPLPNNPDRKHRYLQLFTKRVRHFSYLKPKEMWKLKDAWNFMVQGTGNELNRLLVQYAHKQGVEIVMLVHDSILCYIKEDELDETLRKIMKFLESDELPLFYPRMGLDVKVGTSWGDAQEYEVRMDDDGN